MSRVICIVEGHGEVIALPVLLRRIAAWRFPERHIDVLPPIRVKRDQFLNDEEQFKRFMQLAGMKSREEDAVLVLLDADDDCPASFGPFLLQRARHAIPHRSVSVVLANREFEAWYIGAAKSLDGYRGLTISPADLKSDPEQPRDAKGWLRSRMGARSYGETTDQPAFAAKMDMDAAYERCRSFRKLCSDLDRWFMS
ncbi:DUF4276 family protein [Tahibacter harae]|uniref:DUF4276 family protein n=1 Tax=Tahibacter harae TaxID=2963937 RepID=A0ABT1QXQ4_9GAMM|nr:DUF4276 family protein [Tahibacter harae]MCQ4167053.1 DUF4276 family protein [Tahibacter harae]